MGEKNGGIRPENIVWQFGSGRTGSTWLSLMMRDFEGWTSWGEPLVGKLFGDLWRWKGSEERAENAHFILPSRKPELWMGAVRTFVLEAARVRFPDTRYLYVSEPNGTVGAEPLMRAFPDSRMVLLLRDPRDIVASFLDGARGGWLNKGRGSAPLAMTDPDRFVLQQARSVHRNFGAAWRAYSNHKGPRTRVRYEDLRADTFGTMEGLLTDLGVPTNGDELRRVVDRHGWENPAFKFRKGPGRKRRKAKPGGWREDLTPEQVETVEEICQPLLEAFYADSEP